MNAYNRMEYVQTLLYYKLYSQFALQCKYFRQVCLLRIFSMVVIANSENYCFIIFKYVLFINILILYYQFMISYHFMMTLFQGMESVFSLYWLALFSAKELQRLIFYSNMTINVEDLKKNCYYLGMK